MHSGGPFGGGGGWVSCLFFMWAKCTIKNITLHAYSLSLSLRTRHQFWSTFFPTRVRGAPCMQPLALRIMTPTKSFFIIIIF